MRINTKTEISTEYAPFVLTEKNGKWRKVAPFFFKSQESAERALQKIKENDANNPFKKKCMEYKVMKRTAITTISEWEDIEPTEKEGGK